MRTTRRTRSPTCRACRRRSKGAGTTIRNSAASRKKSSGGWTGGPKSRRSAERPSEQILDRFLSVRLQRARSGTGEMRVRNDRRVRRAALLPVLAAPREPAVLLLIEDVQRLVAQLRELRAPARAAAHRPIIEDRADDVDFLAAVDLVPDRLQDFPDRGCVGVTAVHQLRHVGEADVSVLQLFVVEHTNATTPLDRVALECEVDFLDAVALGTGAERRFGARCPAAEQDRVVCVHFPPLAGPHPRSLSLGGAAPRRFPLRLAR